MVDRIGEQLGAYMVLAHVADGSMGSVYEARHRESGERVAVKVLHAKVARDPGVERWASAPAAAIEEALKRASEAPAVESIPPFAYPSSIPVAPPMRDNRTATIAIGFAFAAALVAGVWLILP